MKPVLLLLLLLGGGLVLPTAMAQNVCNGHLGSNIIPNGDFGTGLDSIQLFDPSYAPNYVYQTNGAPTEGQYTIAHTAQLLGHDCWISTNDNGNDPNGYFMLVNSASQASIIYERTLEICDGINYLLSLDLINLRSAACVPPGGLPDIDLLVDGQVVLALGDLAQTETWNTFSQLIEIPPGTDLINVALRNNNPEAVGNDLGIDNITLQHCGPELSLPATTFLCPDGGRIELDNVSIDYQTPYYQWQQSFDGGNIWLDLVGENDPDLDISNPTTGIYYRVLVANGPVNFLSESCRIASNATRLEVRTPLEIYRTPVICAGDSVQVGHDVFTEAGNYTTLITGNSGCDTLIHTLVFTLPVYEQWFFQSLCEGDSFLGQMFQNDTLISRSFVSSQGCDSVINYDISVFSIADLALDGATRICTGESTDLTINASYPAYAWSTGAQTAGISVTQSGTYSLTVSSAQGCASSTSINVVVSDPFMEVFAEDPSCPGPNDGRIEVLFQDGGIAPYRFSLDREEWTESTSFENLSPGEYTVHLRDSLGCENRRTLLIQEARPLEVNLAGLPPAGVEAGDSIQLRAVSTTPDLNYNWSGSGIFGCQNCITTSWIPILEGQLQLEVQSAAGCSQIIDTSVVVHEPLRVYIPNAFSPNGDGFNDTFFPAVGSNVKSIENWSVYDRWGGQMFHRGESTPHDPALAWDGTWRGEMLASGVYLYRAEISFNNGRTKIFAGEVYLK